jgi:hypothetical protein
MIVQLKDSNQLLNKQLLVHTIKISLPHSLYISLHKRYKKVGFDICGYFSELLLHPQHKHKQQSSSEALDNRHDFPRIMYFCIYGQAGFDEETEISSS